jgi:uncharacterized membrane protein
MKNKKAIVAMWVLALVPAVLVALAWPYLPEQVPTHWGLDGQVNGYSAPAMLWVMAAVSPAVALLLQVLPRLDPRRENYGRFQGSYDFFGVVFALFYALIMGLTLWAVFRPERVNMGKAVGVLVGVLFIVVGNMMGKVKTNWFMGFRTPWALSDPDVWNKTQRLGGWVMFLAGLASVVLSLAASATVYAIGFFTVLFGGILLTYYMSWRWYREKQ